VRFFFWLAARVKTNAMFFNADIAGADIDFMTCGVIMSTTTSIDAADAFETAYQVLIPGSEDSGLERRGSERYPFRFVQQVAAYDGQDSLAELRFFPVQCHDISRSGLGFMLPGPIGFKRVVVELGDAGQGLYFEGEMVNQRPVNDSPIDNVDDILAALGLGSASPGAMLVGCRLVGKLDLNPA
jgi:hypothetical protein